ncbi:MAG: hypothetical protein QXR30_02650 [Candidatus Woesearchaeota archaeon]
MDHRSEQVIEELNAIFQKIREEKSYKVAGVPDASLKVKCSKCHQEVEFAHCVYDLAEHKIICFRCYERDLSDTDDVLEWMKDFSYEEYF